MSDAQMTDDDGNDFDAYQKWTKTTAIYPAADEGTEISIVYTTLGLVNEAGEFAGKVKKWIRDETPGDELAAACEAEAGDVLWYLARVCDELGISLSEVAIGNQRKLMDRKSRDVIGGSGDKR